MPTEMKLPVGITTLHLSRRSVLLLLLAVGLIGYGGYDYIQQSRAVNDAVAVRATVTDAHVDRLEGGRGIDYRPEVEYTYRYQGETYTSEQVFPGIGRRTYSDRSKAQSVVASYEPGTTARAYVDPATPSDAFLIRERTPLPARAVALGCIALGIVVLAGLGSQNPGQQEVRPAADVQSPQRQTWIDRNGETVNRLSKRLLGGCFVAFWLSMVALFFGLLNASDGSEGPSQAIRADTFGPIGLPMVAGFVFWIGMVLALSLYGVWSFSEYRKLRYRLKDPKPPSPFRHPSRLVTILGTDDGTLSEYGQRVRMTGWVFVIAAGMTAVILYLLYTAS